MGVDCLSSYSDDFTCQNAGWLNYTVTKYNNYLAIKISLLSYYRKSWDFILKPVTTFSRWCVILLERLDKQGIQIFPTNHFFINKIFLRVWDLVLGLSCVIALFLLKALKEKTTNSPEKASSCVRFSYTCGWFLSTGKIVIIELIIIFSLILYFST